MSTIGRGELGEKAIEYSLKLERDANPVAKFLHYVVAPGMFAVNAVSDVRQLREAKSVTPKGLEAAGFSPAEAVRLKTKIDRVATARAVGDALGWAAYPLSFRSKPLHYGTTLLGAFGPSALVSAVKRF